MFFKKQIAALDEARDEAKSLFAVTSRAPSLMDGKNIDTFFGELGQSAKLIIEEPEIILFAVLQWFVIGAAYFLWTQVLDWIPDSVWQELAQASDEGKDSGEGLINLLLLGWSFVVVALASYPLSLLNAAIIAVHYLRSSGQPSTIGTALSIAMRNMGRLWIFSTIDAWITVNAIVDRLPKKNDNGRRRTAMDEVLYYAWKIGTFGVVPALVAGRGFIDAAKDAVTLLKENTGRVVGIRLGYSLIAWIVGVLAYLGALYWFAVVGGPEQGVDAANGIYNFYMLMGGPIVVAVGVLNVCVRPFYMIMLARVYTARFPYSPPEKASYEPEGANALALFFVVFLVSFLAITLFAEPLGFSGWVEGLAMHRG